MRGYFRNMNERMRQWMAGRYGMDELSRALTFTGCGMLLLACWESLRFLYFPALIIWACSIFRTYSRNIYKRQKERQKYLERTGKICGWFSLQRNKWVNRKTHKYIRCPQCRNTCRVPKGKGRIRIRCPHCKTEIIEKT